MSQFRIVRLMLTARPAWAARSSSTPRMERTRPSNVRPGRLTAGFRAFEVGAPRCSFEAHQPPALVIERSIERVELGQAGANGPDRSVEDARLARSPPV